MQMPLSSSVVRKTFLDYFKRRKHAVVASSSLIPAGDPTLLFANAGMVQFKDTFLGREKRDYTRATTSQKCMRVSGKHNDLENVGPSPRHHTFFEMLGNFSFGDYFKADAIKFAWDLLVNHYELDPTRLWFTIFEGDDEVRADEEAANLWVKAGAAPDRVRRFSRKDNFWQMGDTGPCGPCSEIHYYRGKHPRNPEFNRAEYVNGKGEETIEIWNLVFMQFNRYQDGDGFKLDPLPKPSVDTGAGLERVTAVLQGKLSNYETDLFKPIIEHTRKLLGHDKDALEKQLASYRVIADHSRAIAFLTADGVVPGNEGRNYVLRLILRRAARHGYLLGFQEPFLTEVLPTVIEMMSEPYPELEKRRDAILKITREEEKRFQATLKTGSALLEELVDELRAKNAKMISGADAFKLHDTYGFALELTRDYATAFGMQVDEAGFRKAMEEQADRSRAASAMGIDVASEQKYIAAQEQLVVSGVLPASGVSHDPYSRTELDTTIAGILRDGDLVEQANAGDQVEIVLPATCFYVESGGQITDTGRLVQYVGIADGAETEDANVKWAIEITDARAALPGLIVHVGKVVKGAPRVGDQVAVEVDRLRRWDIMRNHTATHLLHRELRYALGEHVQQAGSLVAPDRFRFDFTHNTMLTQDELNTIEQAVNDAVLADFPVVPFQLSYKEAVAGGAMALFTEKYGDRVRVIKVGDPGHPFSQELCGGTHVQHTSQIGAFHIVSESSIGAGLRRIEAVTGHGAAKLLQENSGRLDRTAAFLRTTAEQIESKVLALMSEIETQRKEIEKLRRDLALRDAEGLLARVQQVGEVRVLATQVQAANADTLRELADFFRDRMGSGIVVLGAAIDGKPSLIAAVTPDLVAKGFDAGKIVREVAKVVGGGGGGKPNLAQAGGKDVSRLAEALAMVVSVVGKA
ncbi:MAG: alanine--tRNA ligase [Chloroflexi bacterium]|nr:alanine--tRNA ligase [Chloroflexota bacterium]